MTILRYIAIGSFLTVSAYAAQPQINPVDARWTFGAHEPYTMYRRVGRHCTGGINGNAKWLKPWMDWFDSESPALMEKLGLNWLHCRFYKGMGWEVEKKDFPNVKRFVGNCHKHGVRALAYVQFATLYPETMKREFPNLEEWAQVGLDGQKLIYHGGGGGSYFRWLPCVTCDEWVEHLEKVCTIALTEGGFDGIMFDNAFAHPCYCKRCERKFHEHLMRIKNPEERFGFDSLEFVQLPRIKKEALSGEVRDPVVQEWCRWRQKTIEGVFARLRAHIKSVKPDAVVSANPQPFRSAKAPLSMSLNMYRFVRNLDLVILQSANYPQVMPTGEIVNRIRDLKLCREVGKPVVALCDSDAMLTEERERHYLLPLLEDLIWGGVPTDRTIVSPKPVRGFVDKAMIERRRPKLAAFNAFARSHRDWFSAPSLMPVRLLWTPDVIGFSEESHLGLAAAEEILLRNHVPFGYVASTEDRPLEMPAGCEVLVVANQTCLSDSQIAAIVAYAKRGGRLVVTGDSGRCDEWNAQRLENPLKLQLAGLPNVVLRDEADMLPSARLGWSYRISAPKDGGKALMADLKSVGYRAPLEFKNLPPHVFAEYRTLKDGRLAVHLLNYAPDRKVEEISVDLHGMTAEFSEPFGDGDSSKPVTIGKDGVLPSFGMYATLVLKR